MDEWISVEEQLPEVDERVLVMCGGDVGIGFLPIHKVAWVILTGAPRDSKVTHWISLPDPPKKKGPFYGTSRFPAVYLERYGYICTPSREDGVEDVCRRLNEVWQKRP